MLEMNVIKCQQTLKIIL